MTNLTKGNDFLSFSALCMFGTDGKIGVPINYVSFLLNRPNLELDMQPASLVPDMFLFLKFPNPNRQTKHLNIRVFLECLRNIDPLIRQVSMRHPCFNGAACRWMPLWLCWRLCLSCVLLASSCHRWLPNFQPSHSCKASQLKGQGQTFWCYLCWSLVNFVPFSFKKTGGVSQKKCNLYRLWLACASGPGFVFFFRKGDFTSETL